MFSPRFLLFTSSILFISLCPCQADDSLSTHREKLGVSSWHAAGYLGKGVKVCILDTDFAGYQDELGETLPRKLKSRSFRIDRALEQPTTGHGLRAGQVVHALAPRAELMFANWDPCSPDYFLGAIRWAKEQGARIITCSVTSAAWGDGDAGGPVHRDLEALLGQGEKPGEPLFICSAGNMAQGHWSGVFVGGVNAWHQWKPGQCDNWLTPFGESRVKISLLHKPGQVYELTAFEGASDVPLARRCSDSIGSLVGPCLSFAPIKGKQYRVRVRLVNGPPGEFHCVARCASLNLASPRDSVCCFPADNPRVVTVGACDWQGKRISYSAYGDGKRRYKPELVAPVPFPCPGKEPTFGGTSAAAPQVAGLAALLADRYPTWTASQLREFLFRHAIRAATDERHLETGFGRIYLIPPTK